ncbi:hypothetical protein [Campylobacter troglodytis]|uniref:hypothetical protein n=1 Tax=Campylobacter troglodytis TaxID=654363 RepID=UPI00115BE837|nr:hypothetical protein [Campylobacter troglodytis]TQR59646.1 hypothetical protein DMC01_06960 [Campylobacter troglodytis]
MSKIFSCLMLFASFLLAKEECKCEKITMNETCKCERLDSEKELDKFFQTNKKEESPQKRIKIPTH